MELGALPRRTGGGVVSPLRGGADDIASETDRWRLQHQQQPFGVLTVAADNEDIARRHALAALRVEQQEWAGRLNVVLEQTVAENFILTSMVGMTVRLATYVLPYTQAANAAAAKRRPSSASSRREGRLSTKSCAASQQLTMVL